MSATNINQVMTAVLSKAFDPTKEDDFVSSSRYPRYADVNYLKAILTNLEDNNEIENISITLKTITVAPIAGVNDDYSQYLALQVYEETELPTTKTYKAVRKSLTSYASNPIQVINNVIDLNKSFDIPIEMLIKYTQTFRIEIGQTLSNAFDIINQNTEYDKHFYIYLTDETVASIGNQAAYNALRMKNLKATYTSNPTKIDLNKYVISINNPVGYVIEGTIVTYSSITIPKNVSKFNLPVMRLEQVLDYNTSFEIIDINTGTFNVVTLKSEPIFTGSKYYDRIVAFMDNKNISGNDIEFKIESIKNIYIPKGEVQGSYTLNVVNALPSISNSSPVTSVASFDPYDYNSSIVNLNRFPPAPELTPEELEDLSTYSDTNIITDETKLHIFGPTAKLTIDEQGAFVVYNANISEFGSIVNIYEGTTLIGQGQIDNNGNFSTYLFNPLLDGNHTIYFKIKDSGGNESLSSPSISFTVDTVSPVPPIISSYYNTGDILATNIKTWESASDLYKFQMYGTTNNQYPYIIGFVPELSKVNLYVNEILVKSDIDTFEQTEINNDRMDNIYGFVYRPMLTVGLNTITYEFIDQAGNISSMSQAAYIIYSPVNLLSPTVYILDDQGHNIELTDSTTITTDDSKVILYGNGAKNKTYAEVYKVNPDTSETLLGKALVKKSSWSFELDLLAGTTNLRFKIKSNDTGDLINIDKTINLVGTRPTSIITVEDIPNEPRYKKLIITFDKPVYGLTIDDFLVSKCILLRESKFGIDPLETIDNITYNGVIYFVENYSATFNDGFVQLRDTAIWDTNGIYNIQTDTTPVTGLSNMVISITQDSTDYSIPFTPLINLTVMDSRFGERVIKQGEITNDPNPKFSGIHIGAWSEDSIYPLPLTRTFKIPNNENFYTEVLESSPFDKYRSRIVNFITGSGNNLNDGNFSKAFCHLTKTCPFFDYMYFKDDTTFIFPQYNKSGDLYYRTVQVIMLPPSGPDVAPIYMIREDTIIVDNFETNPIVRDMLVNRLAGYLKNGELNLTSNELQDPVVTYQIITNDKSNYSRRGLIKIERYVIIFVDQNQATFRMYLDNPMGLAAIPDKFYDENLTLDFEPTLELLVQKAIFPNYETFEVISDLGPLYHINFTKVPHTDSTIGEYKFELKNSTNVSVNATFPVIIKLNLFYNDTISANQNVGKKLVLPIKPYQVIDNSNIMYFSWLDFYVVHTNLKKVTIDGKDKLIYSVTRNKNGNSYKIQFNTIKKIKFRPYDILTESINTGLSTYSFSTLNEYNLNYNDVIICKNIEIIDEMGTQYSDMFEVNYNSKTDQVIRIYPLKTDNPDMYKLLDTVELTIKISFEMVLNNTYVEFTHDYLNNEFFKELEYFKIDSITNLDGSSIQDINFIKVEYLPNNVFESIRVNGYDNTNNMHSSTNSIEVFDEFSTYLNKVTTSPTTIYPRQNDFNFKNDSSYIDRIDFSQLQLEFPSPVFNVVTINKEQSTVRDLAYYGLNESCEIIYEGGIFKVKANSSVYLNDINFTDEEDLLYLGEDFDPILTDSFQDTRLNKRPPSYIWVHLDTPNGIDISNVNNMSTADWLNAGSVPTLINPIGKYVPWVWDDVCEGDFWINGNQLEGLTTKLGNPLPSTINGSFRCNNNLLTDLVGGPSILVKGSYIAKNNKLNSLIGIVPIIGGISNIYLETDTEKFPEATDASWTTQQSMFNDIDTNLWNDPILELNRIGSSLDISFNSNITPTTITNMPVINVGWHVYIAGTGLTYSDTDINLIRSKITLAGLVYTYFDDSEYRYLVKDPAILTNVSSNITHLANYGSSTNPFTRTLDISDTYPDTIRKKTSTSTLYSLVKLGTTNYVENEDYHKTSEEIV